MLAKQSHRHGYSRNNFIISLREIHFPCDHKRIYYGGNKLPFLMLILVYSYYKRPTVLPCSDVLVVAADVVVVLRVVRVREEARHPRVPEDVPHDGEAHEQREDAERDPLEGGLPGTDLKTAIITQNGALFCIDQQQIYSLSGCQE